MKEIKYIPIEKIHLVQDKLLNWYSKKGRTFPWREKSASSYELIISEVLLQRTKAETVKKFFPGFISKYPGWDSLRKAPLQKLQEDLRPVGLYRQKASRVKKLAESLTQFNGEFPQSIEKIKTLPMIGHYLLSACILFIIKKPAPLLDVNMARVLERVFGERELVDIRYDPYLNNLAARLVNIPYSKSRKLNWAILDLGSVVCTIKNPRCQDCPLTGSCNYFESRKRT
ncbi:hypothetical protein [Zunongwangia sp. HRR-M8]|uniref:hypothetical protein n=1 Tax=Zunongwangia sp. HRR-M8 TaxID=3015170 RepID=UPI0022DD7814|nr:hypothetical protein [Zunongwangia sp. HRR-M8]WBL22313.1 hypothetical protein PBT89_16560 [Zunongwangia sp. HRR-M8]